MKEPQAYNLYDPDNDQYQIFDKEDKLIKTVPTAKEAIEETNWLNNPENVPWWFWVGVASWALYGIQYFYGI